MRPPLTVLIAAMTVASIAAAAPAVADPATPAPVDCGPYGGISAALDHAGDHMMSPPLGTPAPPDPNLRADAPIRCQ